MRQRDIMLHMGRVDAKMVSKIHCTLKKQVAPPGTWARCVVRLQLSPTPCTLNPKTCCALKHEAASPGRRACCGWLLAQLLCMEATGCMHVLLVSCSVLLRLF